MGARLGLVTGSGASPVEAWFRGIGEQIGAVPSPPASLSEVTRTSSPLILVLSDGETRTALSSLRDLLPSGVAVVSTCSTLSLELMRSLVGPAPVLFRAVISCGNQTGEGAVALTPEAGTSTEVVTGVSDALNAFGAAEIVSESMLAAVAALCSGSAGFLCTALEGLQDGAVNEGLPREMARVFANQTTLATALLLRDHAGSPADLKDQVASPGGTTIAALAVLEDQGVRGAFIRAVERATAEIRARQDAGRPGVIE